MLRGALRRTVRVHALGASTTSPHGRNLGGRVGKTPPPELWVVAAAAEDAVGKYILQDHLFNQQPYWMSTDQERSIFADPQGRWKMGLTEEMEYGVGDIKTQFYPAERFPEEMRHWMRLGDLDKGEPDWVPDPTTIVASRKHAGSAVALHSAGGMQTRNKWSNLNPTRMLPDQLPPPPSAAPSSAAAASRDAGPAADDSVPEKTFGDGFAAAQQWRDAAPPRAGELSVVGERVEELRRRNRSTEVGAPPGGGAVARLAPAPSPARLAAAAPPAPVTTQVGVMERPPERKPGVPTVFQYSPVSSNAIEAALAATGDAEGSPASLAIRKQVELARKLPLADGTVQMSYSKEDGLQPINYYDRIHNKLMRAHSLRQFSARRPSVLVLLVVGYLYYLFFNNVYLFMQEPPTDFRFGARQWQPQKARLGPRPVAYPEPEEPSDPEYLAYRDQRPNVGRSGMNEGTERFGIEGGVDMPDSFRHGRASNARSPMSGGSFIGWLIN